MTGRWCTVCWGARVPQCGSVSRSQCGGRRPRARRRWRRRAQRKAGVADSMSGCGRQWAQGDGSGYGVPLVPLTASRSPSSHLPPRRSGDASLVIGRLVRSVRKQEFYGAHAQRSVLTPWPDRGQAQSTSAVATTSHPPQAAPCRAAQRKKPDTNRDEAAIRRRAANQSGCTPTRAG